MKQERIGDLDCVVVDGSESPDIPVVLCHGFGAPGNDLVPLAGQLIKMLGAAADRFRFVFPEAPISLAEDGMPGARAWWRLNMQRLMELFETNDFSQLRPEVPPGIDESRAMLATTINQVMESLGAKQYVIGGFSQGAMLTMDTALRGLEHQPAGLCQFSGTLICEDLWKENASQLSSTKVVQTHGTSDFVLPFVAAEWLRDELSDAAASWEFAAFAGPHTIPFESYELTVKLLSELAEAT